MRTRPETFPGPIDWILLAAFVITVVWNTATFGPVGLVVYLLLLYAAYRLGKSIGR